MITAETNKSLPLCEISTIIIETTLASITSALIIKAMENGIAILFCNDRHQIQSEVVSLTSHHSQSGNVHIQCKWQSKTKDKLWASIIKEKISMQKQVLLQATGTCPQIMSKYYKNVTDGDATNREGQAARIHFNTLFGIDFIRHEDDQNNAMLNYGYAILHSRVSQAVILCGYITNIGIKHIGKTNPFNLSYDLIEPFRPLVDAIVYRHRSEVLNQECKKDLINVLYQKISYGGRIFSVGDAIELFVRDCLNSMKKEEMLLKKNENSRDSVVFLCYDLPVETTKQKSDYRHFTKFIKSIGFIMIQNSIGIKYIRNHDSFRKEVAALRTKCPKEGEIYLWNISFNKYRSVVVLQGRGVPIEELRETIVIL